MKLCCSLSLGIWSHCSQVWRESWSCTGAQSLQVSEGLKLRIWHQSHIQSHTKSVFLKDSNHCFSILASRLNHLSRMLRCWAMQYSRSAATAAVLLNNVTLVVCWWAEKRNRMWNPCDEPSSPQCWKRYIITTKVLETTQWIPWCDTSIQLNPVMLDLGCGDPA